MQFGLFTHLPWHENTVPRRLIDEITEQVQYGEALGFQGAWFAEHHFSRYGLGSSSLVLLGPWPRKPGPYGWGPPSWCRRYTTRFAWPKTLPWSMSSATGASMSVLAR